MHPPHWDRVLGKAMKAADAGDVAEYTEATR